MSSIALSDSTIHGDGTVSALDHYVHAIIAALGAKITTAFWFGAIENASD